MGEHLKPERNFMKKFAFAISSFLFAAASFGASPTQYDPDPVFSADILAKLEANLPAQSAVKPKQKRKVLVFARTTTFRHYHGIVAGKFIVEKMGQLTGAWETVVSDDFANFEPDALKKFDCVVFCNTTGAPFSEMPGKLEKMTDAERKAVLERDGRLRENLVNYVKNGGGFFGIHAATDTYHSKDTRYEPYVEMIGGSFISHPWTSNDVSTSVIEDPASPITRGVWKYPVRLQDEIYMLANTFDRSKLRVLAGLDADRSPVKGKVREDKDIPTIWIKAYGKGRVAYGSYGHSQKPYLEHKEIPLMYMRMIQFACGDLAADTTPIVAKPSYTSSPKIFDVPMQDYVKGFSSAEYGDNGVPLDAAVFAFYNYNDDPAFCKAMGTFLLKELASKNGTDRYRALLAQFVDAVGAKDSSVRAQLEKVIASEKDDAVRSRLSNVLAHEKGNAQFKDRPAAYSMPQAQPASARDTMRVITFAGRNKTAPIPAWMRFENMKTDFEKAALVYALSARNEGWDAVRALDVKDGELAIASAYAASVMGDANEIARLVGYVGLLGKEQRPRMIVNILGIKPKGKLEALTGLLKSKNADESAFAAEILACIDVSKMAEKILKDYDTAQDSEKAALITVMESLAGPQVFIHMVAKLPEAKDAALKNSICKLLVRSAQGGVDNAMFEAAEKTYSATSDAADKGFLLRFAPPAGTQKAAELCERACKEGYAKEAMRYLSQWNGMRAADSILKIAAASNDANLKAQALSALMALLSKFDLEPKAFEYAYKNGSKEDKDALLALAFEKPNMDVAKFLEANGQAETAKKMLEAIKNTKPVLTASYGGSAASLKAALDGKMGSRWSSNAYIKKGAWIMLDFGCPRTVSEVVFDSAASKNDFPKKITVLAGSSEDSLSPVKFSLDTEGNKMKITFEGKFTARFVKVVSDEDSNRWWSVHEIIFQ